MKMTWKKKNGNKRLAVPNLPFDNDNDYQQDDDEEQQHKRPNSPSSINHQNPQSNQTLAHVFLEQGNKLAEVILHKFLVIVLLNINFTSLYGIFHGELTLIFGVSCSSKLPFFF